MAPTAHQAHESPPRLGRARASPPCRPAVAAACLIFPVQALWAQQPPAADPSWTLHAQTTFIDQMHPGFAAPYSGANSLDPNQEIRHTLSLTLFLGHALWRGAALYFDPEVTQGGGLSNTTGVAGFPNGEGSRASSASPQYDTARLFIRQVLNLGGASARVDDDQNQVAQA